MNEIVLEELMKKYEVNELDIGSDAHLSSKGMHFEVHSYEIKGLGHFCTISMKAMLGLMKMETAVVAAENVDVPLLNADRVLAMGNKTQLVEFYDNQLNPISAQQAEAYEKIRKTGDVFEKYGSGEHWYDSILYPFSYARKKKGDTVPFDHVTRDYIQEYVKQAGTALKCDPAEKKKKTAEFARTLLGKGGPAVNQMKKLFGDEIAERLILTHMYGIER